MRKLVCALACRNDGSRLYGKPMQNLDYENGYSVLEYMIDEIRTFDEVDDIVIGISEGKSNLCFIDFCERKGVKYIIGDEEDVLGRLIDCTELVSGTDIFRVTSESPFIYFEALADAWKEHVSGDFDITMLDNLPDGVGFELIKLDAYKKSHDQGDRRHRSELCSLFIRENKDKFKLNYFELPSYLKRTDIRLTIDHPEDLVLCRAVYQKFKALAPRIPIVEIMNFLDRNPDLKKIVEPFREEGLKTMYL